MTADPVRAIADAVLYEGYLLWPYRRSAIKNRRRWTFGGIYPRAWSDGRDDDPWVMRASVLLEGAAEVDVRLRFLHVVRRQVVSGGVPVDEVEVGGERFVSWEEATEREFAITSAGRMPVVVEAGREEEVLSAEAASAAPSILRTWEALAGSMDVSIDDVGDGVVRVSVVVENESPFAGGSREAALAQTFCSSHLVLRATGGAFVSMTDPPQALRETAAQCENEGVWPVLVGEPGARDVVLASPIILEDHPRIAPESPGDLFDGGEIDGLLTLSILSLTDEEKAEMRASDPRARAILDRTESLSHEEIMAMHGTLREIR